MKLKLSCLFLIFLFIPPTFSQNSCLYKDVKELEKDYAKNKKKVIKKFDGKGNLAYCIAECYRINNDSTCSQWYREAADEMKKDYAREDSKNKKALLLYKIGLCYFYTGDFKQAELYLRKSIKAKIDEPLVFYFLAISLKGQNRCSEAIEEFSNYKKQCSKCEDTDKLIEECMVEMEKGK